MTTTPFKLSKPITAHGKELTELELKRPNGGTVRRCGFPFKLKDGAPTDFDSQIVAAYVVEMAGIPPSSFDQLEPRDTFALAYVVASFFGDATPEKSPPDISS